MILGDFNKVLVIDENFNEVKELISYLNQKGVANFYFDGEQSSLPAKRLCGIRAIFLDIELKGMEGQNKKTMASKIIGVLDNILHKDNGPFIIFFWSKHGKPYADEVVKRCYENHMSLCGYLTLDKKPDNRQVINQIDQKITTYLQEKLGLFTLIKWECALTKGGTSYINEISQLADPSSKDWSTNYLHLLVWLGNKYRNISMDLGNENENKESIIISDVLINRGFSEKLLSSSENELSELKQLFNNSSITRSKFKITDEIIARLNSILFLSKEYTKQPFLSGCVFKTETTDLLESSFISTIKIKKDEYFYNNAKDFLDSVTKAGDIQHCLCVITPVCDLAWKKTLYEYKKIHGEDLEDEINYRIVSGTLFKDSLTSKYTFNSPQSRYYINKIWYEDEIWSLVFDFGTISTISASKLVIDDNFMFYIKRDVFFDLQSKAANQINRLGNFILR